MLNSHNIIPIKVIAKLLNGGKTTLSFSFIRQKEMTNIKVIINEYGKTIISTLHKIVISQLHNTSPPRAPPYAP